MATYEPNSDQKTDENPEIPPKKSIRNEPQEFKLIEILSIVQLRISFLILMSIIIYDYTLNFVVASLTVNYLSSIRFTIIQMVQYSLKRD